MNEVLVRLRGVVKDYRRAAETVHVLQSVNLDIERGDFLALMGPSGSGKSTLLNLIGGLDRPSQGQIEIAGQRIEPELVVGLDAQGVVGLAVIEQRIAAFVEGEHVLGAAFLDAETFVAYGTAFFVGGGEHDIEREIVGTGVVEGIVVVAQEHVVVVFFVEPLSFIGLLDGRQLE